MTMRHRITMKHDTATDDTVDPTWANFMTGIPCDILQTTGGERVRGVQLQADTTVVISTRFYSGFLPNMRAVNEFSSAVYEISRIVEVNGRQRFLMIEATEVLV